MDERSQKELDRILHKNIKTLTEEEKAFIKARQSYLKEADKKAYASIIGGKKKAK